MAAHRLALLLLFFASGFTGLVYEVLWLRQLALVFGNTAYAAATTLAVFFLGLALGQRGLGRRAARLGNPVRTYARLELGVAASAALAFALVPLLRALDPWLLSPSGSHPHAASAGRLVACAAVLLPPAFLMGATLPVMGQVLVRRTAELGRTFAVLYGANTLGGALGALAAGFFLPARLGFRQTYLLNMALGAAIGGIAYWIGRSSGSAPVCAAAPHRPAPAAAGGGAIAPRLLLVTALLSGFLTLGLEVVWTQMFAQVLHNSVYSFAAILVTFLVALGIGSLAASVLGRTAVAPGKVLFALLLAAGVGVAATSFAFDALTGGLRYLAPDRAWHSYLAAVFASVALILVVPGAAAGTVFPYLLKLCEGRGEAPGGIIGRLASLNTAGAVAGSLATGFALLPLLGLWGALRALALVYLLLAAVVGLTGTRLSPLTRALPLLAAAGLLTVLDPTRLASVDIDRSRETVLDSFASAYGTVSVVESPGVRTLRLDSHYIVGANAAQPGDWRQADLPLYVHPRPRSVFFLGMGTGITAGAALFHPVERVVVSELVPDIVVAARKHFAEYANGLFDDPRVRIVIGDGRNVLRASDDRYDVIVAELFVPWHAGTATVYSLEHYRTARERLTEFGLYAQWLPLYQMSRSEFAIIARTMSEAFPVVTFWRGDFLPERPIGALIGYNAPVPLDVDGLVGAVRHRLRNERLAEENAKALALIYYAGNVSQAAELFAAAPLNTDDRPRIEYQAPITQREVKSGSAAWLAGTELSRLFEDLAAAVPRERDDYLRHLTDWERDYVRAGRALYDARTVAAAGDEEAAQRLLVEFSSMVPVPVARIFGAVEPRGVMSGMREGANEDDP